MMGHRMKITFLILAVLAATVIATLEASARMGETIAQCDQRYGLENISPYHNSFSGLSGPGVTNRTYNYQGWIIRTTFVQGRAAMLRYSKAHSQKIEDDEVQAILKSETFGGEWTEKSTVSLNPIKSMANAIAHPNVWTNGIGAEAYYEMTRSSFVIKAPIVEQYKKAKADAAEQQRKSSIPKF
jgi:hypothetical protein